MGTLVALEPPHARLRALLESQTGVHISAERAKAAFGAEIAYYLEHHLEGRDADSLALLRDGCAAALHEALGEPSIERAVVRQAMLDSIVFDAYADAARALHALRAGGLRLVVCSNWDCSLPEALAQAGLYHLVDAIITSAVVGAAKPDERIFEAALDAAGCSAGEAVHVGDSLDADVAGALTAGVAAVLIDRDGTRGPPPPGTPGRAHPRRARGGTGGGRSYAGSPMIQGYRMAGPPPHGEPPAAPPSGERKWPVWLGFAALAGAFIAQFFVQIVALVASGADKLDDMPEGLTLAVQALATLIFVGAALGSAALIKPLKPGQFGLRPTRPWLALGWSIVAMGVFYMSVLLYAALVTSPDQTTADDLGADKSQAALIAVGFLVVVHVADRRGDLLPRALLRRAALAAAGRPGGDHRGLRVRHPARGHGRRRDPAARDPRRAAVPAVREDRLPVSMYCCARLQQCDRLYRPDRRPAGRRRRDGRRGDPRVPPRAPVRVA